MKSSLPARKRLHLAGGQTLLTLGLLTGTGTALAQEAALPAAQASAPDVVAGDDAAPAQPLLLAQNQAFAAAPVTAGTSAIGIAEIVVTAQRREERLQDVPSSISVVSADDLLGDRVGIQAGEVTKYIPNASAASSSGHGRPRWWIRGIGTGAQAIDQQSPVGLYVDDVYISNPIGTGGPLFDLERVEVLRGPQGTLWGKNTTGGAINFISKRPDFVSDGYLYLDYGKYNDQVIQGGFGGAIGDSEALAGRVSFHHQKRDGVLTNLYSGDKEQPITETAARAQVLAVLSPTTELLLKAHVRSHTSRGASNTVIGTNADGSYWNAGTVYIPSTGWTDIATNADGEFEIDQAGAAATLSSRFGVLDFTSITAWEDFSSRTLQDSDATPLELGRSYARANSQQASQEFRLASPSDQRLSWVAGAHYFWEKFDQLTTNGRLDTKDRPAGSNPLYNRLTVDHETQSYALFGSTTFRFNDLFSLSAGLRWTSETREIDLLRLAATNVVFNDEAAWWRPESVDTPLALSAEQRDKQTWNDWGYDITPELKIADNARVFARHARGFRSGGFNSSANSQATTAVIDPEYLISYEVGFKSEWLDNRLVFNSSVFYYDVKDIQINVVRATATGPVSLLANAGEGKGYGAEFEIQALPIDNLTIRSSIGLLRTEFTEFESDGVDYSGNEFVRSPHLTASVGLDYRVPLANGRRVELGTSWNYQGEQFYYTLGQEYPALNQDEGFVLGSAKISHVSSDDKVVVTAYVNNLTDERYKVHTSQPTAGSSPGGAGVFWNDPRTYGVSLTLRW